jgi:hypothetical protein
MKKTQIKMIVIVTILLVVALSVFYFTKRNTDSSLSSQLQSWNVDVKNLENFTITEKSTQRVEDNGIADLTAKSGEQVLRIKRTTNLDEDAAYRYISDRKTLIESIFNPTRSPYFEELTNKVECPEEFRPVYNESSHSKNNVSYYIFFANERFGYGVCSKDLIKYRTIFAVTYCKDTKDFYQLEYFIPNNEYDEQAEETIKSFSC